MSQVRILSSRPCGCSSMVEPEPSKLMTRVRFPSPAPRLNRSSAYAGGLFLFVRNRRHSLTAPLQRNRLRRFHPACFREITCPAENILPLTRQSYTTIGRGYTNRLAALSSRKSSGFFPDRSTPKKPLTCVVAQSFGSLSKYVIHFRVN